MPVVINEFEVIPDTAAPQSANGTNSNSEADAAKQKEKPDFENLLRQWEERADRVRAH